MKRRVLIVDDEALLARTLSQAFRDAGYEATTAGSVEQASGLLSAKAPLDLLILDNRLPGKSGLEFLEACKQRPAKRIVLMTAYDTSDAHQRSKKLGVDLYLTKPFDLSALLSQTEELLERGAKP